MENSADPDQLASSEANWSGSTQFVKAGYIRVHQDKGNEIWYTWLGFIPFLTRETVLWPCVPVH